MDGQDTYMIILTKQKMPRAYECTFVKDPTAPINGLKLSKMVVFGDMQPVMRLAAERGLSV